MNTVPTTSGIRSFELRRKTDELVYVFHRVEDGREPSRFVRSDRADLFIQYDQVLGWVALDPETNEVAGKSWDDDLRHNPDQPAEGDWVSKKGAKSYVYELRHLP